MRIVSLIPSGTEMLGMIGALDSLAGRSHECDYPPAVESVPVLTAQKNPLSQSSPINALAIDTQVRESAALDESLYVLDAKGLAEIKPDVILTQSLCSAGSIDAQAVQSAVDAMRSTPKIIELNAKSIEAIFDEMLMLGNAIGLEDNAVHAVVALKQRMDRAQEHINPYVDGPIVGFMQWTDPIFIAGHWTVQLIERAGGQHPLNRTVILPGSGAAVGPQQAQRVAGHSIAVESQTFADSKPDYLVIAPCGVPLAQAKSETDRLFEACPWFRELPAVINNRVAIVDGNQMFNRPGPRVVDAQEFLIGWLNDCPHLIPEDFPWQQFR